MASNDSYWDEYLNQSHKFPPDEDGLDAILDYVLDKNSGTLQDFDAFWEEVKAYADQYRLSYTYVEEEFVIDGQLIPIHLVMDDDPLE